MEIDENELENAVRGIRIEMLEAATSNIDVSAEGGQEQLWNREDFCISQGLKKLYRDAFQSAIVQAIKAVEDAGGDNVSYHTQAIQKLRDETKSVIKHPTNLRSYPVTGQLDNLAHGIGLLRYDAMAILFGLLVKELRRQSNGDRARGRNQLADRLVLASEAANQLCKRVEDIWRLCEPHMRD